MKKGKINLLSFEEDDETFTIQQRKPSKPTASKPSSNFDLSQIKDRVIQMEMNEEIILEGEAAEALLNKEDDDENELPVELEKRIKEAKEKRRQQIEDTENIDTVEYMPVTTKSEYWLSRDTKESEDAFASNSRLVREDLFNEKDIDDGSYRNFMSEGRRGLMMTSKMLERDIKTEMYDLDLELDTADNLDGTNWERGQVLKGIEKGWNSGESEASFYSKQAKLQPFIPPPKFTDNLSLINSNYVLVDTAEIEKNIEKITLDSDQLETKIDALKAEIATEKSFLAELIELESFFFKFSRFLNEKSAELKEIETTKNYEKWLHFFDVYDDDDVPVEFLNLPDIMEKAFKLNLKSPKHLSELTGIFVKYHFSLFNDNKDPKEIWESSGLKNVFESKTKDFRMIMEIFKEIYVNEKEKYERIKVIFE